MRFPLAAVLALSAAALAARADFSYQEKTQITGGALLKMTRLLPGAGSLREPVYSQVYLQRDRKATVRDREIDIIDLGKEMLIHVDLEKKTYSTIPFAEYRQAMAAMSEKMAKQMGSDKQVVSDMRLSVQEGGESKPIQGMPAKLMKLHLEIDVKDQKSGQTFTNVIDIDEWRTPKVAGHEQVMEFHRAFGEKLGMGPEMMRTMQLAMGQAGTAEGMARLAKEAAKLEGVALVQVTRMSGMGVGIPDMEMPSGAEMGGAAADSAAGAALGRLGRLGGLGGLGRRRKQEEPPPAPKKGESGQAGQPSVLIEATTENSNFSTAAVDASRFAIPAGFKEVEHEMKKVLREMQKK